MGTTRTCTSCGGVITGTLDHCPNDGTALFSAEVMSRVGMLLKDHEIQGVIGEGGMGVVYRAQHVVIEKPVAIKVLYDSYARQKDMVEQFIVEAKAASRIRHPNIIDVTDFGTTPEGLVFLVMEYLDGESLETRLERVKRLPAFEATGIVRQVARGLAAAHELGIVHRDLKPANIFLCLREGRRRIVRRMAGENGTKFAIEPEQSYDFVKLLDFGVAKFLDLGPGVATRNGVLCGTPHYLSPEQASEQPATELSDIYSLGAVFYEMVTGSVPFDGKSMLEILNGHVTGKVVKPSERAPSADLSPQLDAVITKCLEKEPEHRFATADALAEALSGCVTDRAFLRDAHRLPGIESSGLDLSEGSAGARTGRTGVDKGFSEVERSPLDESDEKNETVEIDEMDERPRKSRVSKNTVRIPRTSRKPQVALALLMLAGAAAWALRDRFLASGPIANAPVSVRPTPPPPPPHAEPAKAPPEPAPVAPELKPKPEPVPAESSAKPAAGGPLLGLAPTTSKPLEKGTPTRTRLKPGATAGATASFATIPSEPRPSAPPPPPPVPAPPALPAAPAPVAAPAEATVDIEALLRDAQQAWSKQYYAVAIGKAEAALKIDPGRQTAYQIIAVCSCAIRQADAAKQAVSHLDEHKRRMVQTLCQHHGVTLE
jgi:serine/threonine protein kinase